MTAPSAARLPDGRLHFAHGPIDLILETFGPEAERTAACRQAWSAFRPVLDDLVAVLPLLRTPVSEFRPPGSATAYARSAALPPARARAAAPALAPALAHAPPPAPAARAAPATAGAPARPTREGRTTPPGATGPLPPCGGGVGRGGGGTPPDSPPDISPGSVAARMLAATAPHAPAFVTPMAAVAGAVADHVLAAMTAGRRLERAYVNNGGDAALWLARGTALVAAGGPGLSARIAVRHDMPIRGIATSGWRGRSHSLGIADAVTVLARTAAEADAAATLVANAVDLPGHSAIRRRPASALKPDSDLGDLPVTVAVGPLAPDEVARALAAGRVAAEAMRRRGLIAAAALWLGGQVATVGTALPAPARAEA